MRRIACNILGGTLISGYDLFSRYTDNLTLFRSDDTVEESHLANSFDITCQAWQVRAVDWLLKTQADLMLATIWGTVHALWLPNAHS